MTIELIEGDCREVLREFADNSIDSVVTDPPYALTTGKKGGSGPKSVNLESPYGRARITGFMGKAWDNGDTAFDPAFWADVLRVLKPGGHVLSFGGTRTYHRMACAIEDAGFEIRDQIGWLYGSGFPKSSNQDGEWEGWGTALKPAWEPIVVARKPLIGTNAQNLARWGVGALNIDGCRVGDEVITTQAKKGMYGAGSAEKMREQGFRPYHVDNRNIPDSQHTGRWPANVIHDGSDEVLDAFPQAKGRIAKAAEGGDRRKDQNVYGVMTRGSNGAEPRADSGSAARFFNSVGFDKYELLIWQAKAIVASWNPELANTADAFTNLSKEAVGSALKDAVIWASRGTLISFPELSTSATPTELRLLSEIVTMAILSLENVSLLESPHVKPFLCNARVNVAEATALTGTTTITISRWKSDGSAEPVIFNCTSQNTEDGVQVYGSRFKYEAKASKKDRNHGLEDPGPQFQHGTTLRKVENTDTKGNTHPTVKPTELMRYLVRLVTPPGGTVLDPFMGSGSTGRGAVLEGFNFIGIEMSTEYMDIADARIAAAEAQVAPVMQAAE